MSDTHLRDYLKGIEQKYAAGNATEHTYRKNLEDLLEQLQPGIKATNEPKRSQCGAPDYVITRQESFGPLTIGYVEAKDVGKPLAEIEDDEQLKRYRDALDNLILTDYLEFRWYVQGKFRQKAQLGTVDAKKRKITLDADGIQHVGDLLGLFLNSKPQPISKPSDLAERMAKITHMIREIIVQIFKNKTPSVLLQNLQTAFKDTLLPNLSDAEFADMFAQTLAYGLFAARNNHSDANQFKRIDAARAIPNTNPFLQKLFEYMNGTDLDKEPFVGFVDDLAQLLDQTNMSAVLQDFGTRTQQKDPIIHFYETFLNAYDPKLRELRGVYYTPEPVVSYIVRSVDHILKTDFACSNGLADTSKTTYKHMTVSGEKTEESPRVLILDPACGTGTFLYSVVDYIREGYQRSGNAGMWSGYVRDHLLPRIFGFELLMAPYAMAHLKLGMQLAGIDLPEGDRTRWAYQFDSDERLGVYLTNTLEQAVKQSQILFGGYISSEANEAAQVKQDFPVMVILGNPPYSGQSANKGTWIKNLLHGSDARGKEEVGGNYFEIDGKPLDEQNSKALYNDYVKFIRFAQWRIQKTGYGIIAFITDNSYLDSVVHRGMRQSLMRSFDEIYILDLHGNSNKREKSPDRVIDQNVFDIREGVAISIFVKRLSTHATSATIHHADLWGAKEYKYQFLNNNTIATTEWTNHSSSSPYYLFTQQSSDLRAEFEKGWIITDIFPVNSSCMNTLHDSLAISFDKSSLETMLREALDSAISDDTFREKYQLADSRDWKLSELRNGLTQGKVNALMEKIRKCVYRPFDHRWIVLDDAVVGYPRWETTKHFLEPGSLGLVTTRQCIQPFGCLSSRIPFGQHKIIDTYHRSYVFPLYRYREPLEDGLFKDITANPKSDYTPNLSQSFIADITGRFNLGFIQDGRGDLTTTFGPEDIFAYIYAIFSSSEYCTRYAEFFKIDFPRLPLTSDIAFFRSLCNLGTQLVSYHLMEQIGSQQPSYPEPGSNSVEFSEYAAPNETQINGRVRINATQYFDGVPQEVWEFHIGGHQVCQKWFKDRKGRQLSHDDIQHYQHIVANLAETIRLMEAIDDVIEEHGGWPLA